MSLGPFVGNMFGSLYGGLLGDWVVVRLAKRNKGIFEPEMRLYILLLPALLMGAGLILFGVSADKVSFLALLSEGLTDKRLGLALDIPKHWRCAFWFWNGVYD